MNAQETNGGVGEELVWIDQPDFVDTQLNRRRLYNEESVRYWLALGSLPTRSGNGNGLVQATYDGISKKSGLTAKQVRTVIDRLKKDGEISVRRRARSLEITLFNYEQFQRNSGIVARAESEQLEAPIRYGVNPTVALAFSPEVAREAWSPERMAYAVV
ncbi:hypothetical protein AGMMS49959_07360 [Planctomycetales bacterium]|nr:hypothetical protein AGMMS49959_07360 [Planctomycetales bacterium]